MFTQKKRDPFGGHSETLPHQETLGERHICCQILKGIPCRFIVTLEFLSQLPSSAYKCGIMSQRIVGLQVTASSKADAWVIYVGFHSISPLDSFWALFLAESQRPGIVRQMSDTYYPFKQIQLPDSSGRPTIARKAPICCFFSVIPPEMPVEGWKDAELSVFFTLFTLLPVLDSVVPPLLQKDCIIFPGLLPTVTHFQ